MGETAEVVAQAVRRHARRRRTILARQPAAHGPGAGRRVLRRRDRPDAGPSRPDRSEDRRDARRRRSLVDRDECNRADTTLAGIGEAAAGIRHRQRPRQRHRWQFVAALRRCVGDACRCRRERADALGIGAGSFFAAMPWSAASPTRWALARFRGPEAVAQARTARRRHRPLGTERSLCVAGGVLPRPPRPADGDAQRQRRIDRHRPSVRDDRLTAGRHAAERDARRRKAASASSRCASAADRARRRCSSAHE